MTEFTVNGLRITPQDLSSISPDSSDDDRMFHHDGSGDISLVGGGATSQRGYYVWDNSEVAWFQLFQNADKLDGKDAGDFLHRDGSLAMQATLDLGNYGLINVGEASGGTGGIHLNDNHVTIHSHTAGANIHLSDSNGLLIAEAIEGGNFDVPNGSLKEQGNRVATRFWTNNNADVPNADYADDAGTLDGKDSTAFLQVSGDQMEGALDVGGFNVNDGGTTKYDALAGEFVQSALGGPASSLSSFPLPNADLANSSVTVTAGNQLTGGGTMSLGGTVTVDVNEGSGSGLDSDLLDGYHGADLAALAENETIGGSWTFNASPSVPNGSFAKPAVSFDSSSASIPVTKWANGLSDEEIWRTELNAGESLELHRLEIQPKGGGDVTGLDVDVYDATTATVLASTTDVVTGSPVATSGDGSTILIRISNSSGSSQNASIQSNLVIT